LVGLFLEGGNKSKEKTRREKGQVGPKMDPDEWWGQKVVLDMCHTPGEHIV
jgi:hypothetical protein